MGTRYENVTRYTSYTVGQSSSVQSAEKRAEQVNFVAQKEEVANIVVESN
jgi:hypothetical protein